MKVSCIQMDMTLCETDLNFKNAERLIRESIKDNPDTVVLPETWNTGYFPKENLASFCDNNGERVKATIGGLAKELKINIVAGSVANIKNGKIYNTAYVFNREGECVAEYDKTHLFTPMNEDDYFAKGEKMVTFELDGKKCGILICYDIRFPELTRTLTVNSHLDYLFLVAQWPLKRVDHLLTLSKARAIENQMFVVCTNSCDQKGETIFAGNSAIFNPWGEKIASAGERQEIISATCDESILDTIRNSINVFADRRKELYNLQ